MLYVCSSQQGDERGAKTPKSSVMHGSNREYTQKRMQTPKPSRPDYSSYSPESRSERTLRVEYIALQYYESGARHDRITIRGLSCAKRSQEDSSGLTEGPLTLEEPVSLTDAEFSGVGMEPRLRKERRGRDTATDAAGALVGETFDASAAADWLAAVVEGELKAPSLGRRIFKVGVASVLDWVAEAWPLVGGVTGLWFRLMDVDSPVPFIFFRLDPALEGVGSSFDKSVTF